MNKQEISCLYCKNSIKVPMIVNKQLIFIKKKDEKRCIKCILKKYVPKTKNKLNSIKNDLNQAQQKIDFILRRINLL